VGHVASTPDKSAGDINAYTTTLSDLLTIAGLETKPYVLVADIEGSEHGILTEESDALSACRRMIVELHDEQHPPYRTVSDGLEAINKLGFTIVWRRDNVVIGDRQVDRLRRAM
jgi:hypothetical protein